MNAETLKTIEVPGIGKYVGRSVKVLHDDGDKVQVIWLCGASRVWKKEDLRRALESFQATAKIDSLFYTDQDSHSSKYIARLVDGKNFMADETLSGAMNTAMGCEWEPLRDALQVASGYVKEPVEPMKRPPRKRVSKAISRAVKPKPKPRAKAKPRAKKPPK